MAQAVADYRKALELDPQNEEAARMQAYMDSHVSDAPTG